MHGHNVRVHHFFSDHAGQDPFPIESILVNAAKRSGLS